MNKTARWRLARRRIGLTGSVLTIVVAGWWLLLGGAIMWVMPEPVVAALPTSGSTSGGPLARLHRPGLKVWVIPIERAVFDAHERGTPDRHIVHDNWLTAKDGELVQIVAADAEAAQIEFLEGTHIGQRGWARYDELTRVK